MGEFRHVLTVSGLSPNPQRVIHHGVSLARKFKAALSVVHLVRQNPFELSGGEPVDTVEHDYMVYEAEAKAQMAAVLAEESRRGLKVQELVRYGAPADEIEKVIEDRGVDLVILPARPLGRVEQALRAGWRERLIRELPCSVLLLREEG